MQARPKQTTISELNLAKLPGLVAEIGIRASDYPIGSVTTVNNLAASTRPFTASGLSVALNAEGRKVFVCDGTQIVTNNAAASYWKFLHTAGNKYSWYFKGKIGNSDTDPNVSYGMFGNSAASSTNPGVACLMDNGTSGINDGLYFMHTKLESPAAFISLNNVFQRNRDSESLVTVYIPGAQYGELRPHRNGNVVDISKYRTAFNFNTNDPVYQLQVFAVGNGVLKMIGECEEFWLWKGIMRAEELESLNLYSNHRKTTTTTYLKPEYFEVVEDGYYTLGQSLDKNPVDGTVLNMLQEGGDHYGLAGVSPVYVRTSNDDGFNFQQKYTSPITAAEGSRVINPFSGYTHSGRLGVIWVTRDNTTDVFNGCFAAYSDDNGATWQGKTEIALTNTGYFSTIHRIERLNGTRCAAMVWGQQDQVYSTTGTYVLWFIYSDDNWVTYNKVEVYRGTASYNETCILHAGGGTVFLLARKENKGTEHILCWFKSTDNGNTWANLGEWVAESTNLNPHPPYLYRLTLNGVDITCLLYVNRTQGYLTARYCRTADLITNPLTAFSGKTVFKVNAPAYGRTSPDSNRSGYPSAVNLEGFRSLVLSHYEASDTATIKYYFRLDYHKEQVRTELGIAAV